MNADQLELDTLAHLDELGLLCTRCHDELDEDLVNWDLWSANRIVKEVLEKHKKTRCLLGWDRSVIRSR